MVVEVEPLGPGRSDHEVVQLGPTHHHVILVDRKQTCYLADNGAPQSGSAATVVAGTAMVPPGGRETETASAISGADKTSAAAIPVASHAVSGASLLVNTSALPPTSILQRMKT